MGGFHDLIFLRRRLSDMSISYSSSNACTILFNVIWGPRFLLRILLMMMRVFFSTLSSSYVGGRPGGRIGEASGSSCCLRVLCLWLRTVLALTSNPSAIFFVETVGIRDIICLSRSVRFLQPSLVPGSSP